jgi:hypothetical protein
VVPASALQEGPSLGRVGLQCWQRASFATRSAAQGRSEVTGASLWCLAEWKVTLANQRPVVTWQEQRPYSSECVGKDVSADDFWTAMGEWYGQSHG